jgi:hypothetical protein
VPLSRYALHESLKPEIDFRWVQFKLPTFLVYRAMAICDILEGDGRLTQAIECFRQMQNEDTSNSMISLRFSRTLCRETREAGRHCEGL